MIILKAARVVIHPRKNEVQRDTAIYIQGDTIVSIGRACDVPAETEAQVVDFGEKTLFPGMMDSHVHLAFDGGADPIAGMLASDEESLLLLMKQSANQLVESGVTFARDLGAPSKTAVTTRDAISAGRMIGPTLAVAGRPLTRRQGHCWFMGAEVESATTAREAVGAAAAQGVDLIKLMVTGGRMTAGTDPYAVELSPDITAAAVLEAHSLGLTVAAHCLSAAGVKAAVEAGVDTIEHGTLAAPDGSDGFDAAVVGRMVESGTGLSPTIAGKGHHPLPAELRGAWITSMHEMGVQILAGTDSGIPGHRHSGGIVDGLRSLSEAGLNITEVLASATEEGMRAAGRPRAGALRVGFLADVIAIEGNPFQSLDVFDKVGFVMARGRIVKNDAHVNVPSVHS
ncbi:MAG: amidohydrolase family protein [Homoserinimonas sp.]